MEILQLKNGFNEIVDDYEVFFIDLWGVIHNGVTLNLKAINVLDNLIKKKKRFVLMSNAPRPQKSVANFLKKMNFNQAYNEYIFTSGDAAINSLKLNLHGKIFFHLGPKRDEDLFFQFKEKKKENLNDAEFILCTGLFDNQENDLTYYRNLLKNHIDKKMICTNPDLIVHRDKTEEYCAGSVAKIFEEIGGKVIYYGKPYPDIYKSCIKNEEKILAIGDNLNTDIKGANNMKFHSLLILNGIHKEEFKDRELNSINEVLKKYRVTVNYYQDELIW